MIRPSLSRRGVTLAFALAVTAGSATVAVAQTGPSKVTASAVVASPVPGEPSYAGIAGKKIGVASLVPIPPVNIQVDGFKLECGKANLQVVQTLADPAKAKAAIRTFIQSKVDVIWNISNDLGGLGAEIEAAKKAGIPFITTYGGDVPGSVDIYENEFLSGALVAQYLVDRLNGKGNIVEVGGDFTPPLRQRSAILRSIISQYPGIKLKQFIKINPADPVNSAAKAVEAYLLANKDTDAFYTHWDEPGAGTALAIKKTKSKAFITSWSFDATGIKLVRSGQIQATVAQANKQIGALACRYAAHAVNGTALPERTFVSTGLLRRDNIAEMSGTTFPFKNVGEPFIASPGPQVTFK
jgi:ribose transport system substrate-binding protein